jgi:hypothetical protein
VAAGIGDVKTMLQFVNKECVPSEAARQDRPDAGILGTGGTVRPDASDHEDGQEVGSENRQQKLRGSGHGQS